MRVPEKIRAQLQQEIGSRCPLCSNEDVGHFEVHHINDERSDNNLSNLIMLCRNCHSRITKGDIKHVTVIETKKLLIKKQEIFNIQNKNAGWTPELKQKVFEYMRDGFYNSLKQEDKTPQNFEKIILATECLLKKIYLTMSTDAFTQMAEYEREQYCKPLLKDCVKELHLDI